MKTWNANTERAKAKKPLAERLKEQARRNFKRAGVTETRTLQERLIEMGHTYLRKNAAAGDE